MDDAARMSGGERDRNPQRLVQGASLTWDERIQALLSCRRTYSIMMESFPLADSIVDRDDARVAECGRRLRILHEVATAVCVRHPVSGQYLDGHFTIQIGQA